MPSSDPPLHPVLSADPNQKMNYGADLVRYPSCTE